MRTTYTGFVGNFNPLHREGGDYAVNLADTMIPVFQSTPPRGWRRQFLPDGYSTHHYFNPLHREGGDGVYRHIITLQLDFNPLHREGGD